MLGRARRFGYRLLIKAFQGLPIGSASRYRLKSAVYRRLPLLVASLPDYRQWKLETTPSPPPPAPASPASGGAGRPAIAAPPILRPDECPLEGLRFPRSDDPLVSIVIPVFNHLDFTKCALASIARAETRISYEVIVVDDGSLDGTADQLSTVENLRTLRNAENLGFLRTINRGAAEARGELLLLLNNDTQVTPGWLDSLVDTMRTWPDAGIVGSKLIYPSGHLQEAGARLNPDGTVDLIGLNADPRDPRYNFAREVDHVSAASILVDRALFERLRGLDDRYAPAYYEDCDLSMRVRAAGRKVVYDPRSEVIHHLSVSTQGPGLGKLAQIEKNKQIYLAAWGDALRQLNSVRAIALFLPQYHPIPENDLWWGKGFTEWTNVTKARPNFVGHHQPKLPADLGFYDLRVPEVREHQAQLARDAGLHGFCYYYYWFGGKRLLDRPLDDMLSSGRPDFPFCLCWANENWTRRWDGKDSEILMGQEYSPTDDVAFIESVVPFFRDRRYIRIGDRPLFLLYRASLLPDVSATAERWRQTCRAQGVGEIYLVAVQSFYERTNPRSFGFDAAVQFPPHGLAVRSEPPAEMLNPHFNGTFFDFPKTADAFVRDQPSDYRLFKTAMPSWDNTARRQNHAHIFLRSSPEEYERWLKAILGEARSLAFGDERVVFINAWNEWAEGNYLEPDDHHGHAYLTATARALASAASAAASG